MKHERWKAVFLAAAMSIQTMSGAYAATLTVGAGQTVDGSTVSTSSDTESVAEGSYTPWTIVFVSYVDSDGNVMQGVVARGISVSKWQGTIDWNSVAADDVRFVFARMVSYGYEGEITPDEYFDANMTGAMAAGLYAAPYVYLQTKTTEEARAAAQYAVDTLKNYNTSSGILIAADVESQYILDLSVQELTDVVNAFCQVVEQNGYTPIVYSDYSKFTGEMDVSQIPYDLWYARYGSDGTFAGRTIWQSTDSGSVNGISGNVCLEFAYKDYFGGSGSGVSGPGVSATPGGSSGTVTSGSGSAGGPGVGTSATVTAGGSGTISAGEAALQPAPAGEAPQGATSQTVTSGAATSDTPSQMVTGGETVYDQAPQATSDVVVVGVSPS
ncbi:MAG: hypothetical protein LUE86_12130 [Clostridiales bacterium]|nr:hypothetical protein [Clostridiales bacterium]